MHIDQNSKRFGLIEKYRSALSEAQGTASILYLDFLRKPLEAVESCYKKEPALKPYVDGLDRYLSNPHFALRPDDVNNFSQLLGEAHFWAMCCERGLALTRVQEVPGKKTPDFSLDIDGQLMYFEVKTISVVRGKYGLEEAQMSSLDSNIDLEAQLHAGAKVATSVAEAHPYGTKTVGSRSVPRGAIHEVIDTLIEKVRQNIKPDQFASSNTFMVVNFSVLPLLACGAEALMPAYPDNSRFPAVITGELWTLAFGNPGMLIFGLPEFEGLPAIFAKFDKKGILVDEEYENIAGLLFMYHPLSKPAQLWGLFRNEDLMRWESEESPVLSGLRSLTGDYWNDSLDTNGWRLGGAFQEVADADSVSADDRQAGP